MIKIPVRDIVVVDSFKVVLKDVFVGGIVVNIVVGFPKVELKYIFVGIVVVIIGVDSDNVECKDVLFGIIVVNVIVADVTTVDESSIEIKCKSYHHCIHKRRFLSMICNSYQKEITTYATSRLASLVMRICRFSTI